jgi:hypothetical protein
MVPYEILLVLTLVLKFDVLVIADSTNTLIYWFMIV